MDSKRDQILAIRLSQEEKQHWIDRAKNLGLSMSDVVRLKLNNKKL